MFEELSIVFFRGGEIEVFRRLDEYMEREVCILWFEFGRYIGRRCWFFLDCINYSVYTIGVGDFRELILDVNDKV